MFRPMISTPMPVPLEAYVDTWHGMEAVRWIDEYERDEPFFLFVGFPGPHDPWDAPAEAVARYDVKGIGHVVHAGICRGSSYKCAPGV